jgi:ATP dependent DNA ligase domain
MPPGFIEPCLPSPADRPPSGLDWIHEIKHDGYRLMARRDPIGIRLLTRNGHDWAPRYPLIVEAVNRLKVRSCLIDGEAVACDDNGLAVFERLRLKHESRRVFLFAFDLLELDGTDLRREPLETRKGYARQPAAREPSGPAPERAPHPRRRCRIPPRLQDGPRGHRVEAARFDLSLRPVEGLAEVQEPRGAGGEARGERGVGQGALAVIGATAAYRKTSFPGKTRPAAR